MDLSITVAIVVYATWLGQQRLFQHRLHRRSGGAWSDTDKRRYGTVTRLNPADSLHWYIQPGARRGLRSQNSFDPAYDARGLVRMHPGITVDGADSAR